MSNDSISFSVIVPVYNVSIYLKQCIESIINQEYTNYELILVDDGSTDASPDICDSYAQRDNRVKVIHKPNGGLVSARKAGAQMANGDYVICVDGDDWIDSSELEEIAKVIENYNVDVICFEYSLVNNNCIKKCKIDMREGFYSKENIINDVFPRLIYPDEKGYFPQAIWAKAFRRTLYINEQLETDDRIKIGEDSACVAPCIYNATSIYVLKKALYFYRWNHEAMTKKKQPFSWDGPALIDYHQRKRISNPNFNIQIATRTVHALNTVVMTQFYRTESYFKLSHDIKKELGRLTYQNALANAAFPKGSRMRIYHFCLRNRIIFPLFLFFKFRELRM